MTRVRAMRPGSPWLGRFLLVSFFAFSFFSYLTVDFEHPPSHTSGGATQCDCPGDDAPDPGSMPEIRIPASQDLAFVDLFFPEPLEVASIESGGLLGEVPEIIPRLLLLAQPPPVLLI